MSWVMSIWKHLSYTFTFFFSFSCTILSWDGVKCKHIHNADPLQYTVLCCVSSIMTYQQTISNSLVQSMWILYCFSGSHFMLKIHCNKTFQLDAFVYFPLNTSTPRLSICDKWYPGKIWLSGLFNLEPLYHFVLSKDMFLVLWSS